MAQTQHQTDTAEFLGNLADTLAHRKEAVRTEFLSLNDRQTEGFTLLESLRKHIEVLKSLPATSELLPTYCQFLKEAEEREAALLHRLEQGKERMEQLRTEFNVLNSLRPAEGNK